MDASTLQIVAKTGRFVVRIVKKGAVTVDILIGPFVEVARNVGLLKRGNELCSMRASHAMHRPKDLLIFCHANAISYLFSRMIGSKTHVICRVPILRSKDERKFWNQSIDD